jgi:hypothetical protein
VCGDDGGARGTAMSMCHIHVHSTSKKVQGQLGGSPYSMPGHV